MTTPEFNQAKAIVATRDMATMLKAKVTEVGAQVVITVTNAEGTTILAQSGQLDETLGAAYDTLAASTLTTLATNLQTVITNSTAALTAL